MKNVKVTVIFSIDKNIKPGEMREVVDRAVGRELKDLESSAEIYLIYEDEVIYENGIEIS